MTSTQFEALMAELRAIRALLETPPAPAPSGKKGKGRG